MIRQIPVHAQDITAPFISDLVSEMYPGVTVESADIIQIRTYGDADPDFSVSTSAQVRMDVTYGGAGYDALPTSLLAKMSFPQRVGDSNPELDPFFINEVNFYKKIRPELDIEAPATLGGHFDPESRRFILLMEDLTPKSPHINTMKEPGEVKRVEAAMDTFARLHARFWDSPRFQADLNWVPNLVDSELEQVFDATLQAHIHGEIERHAFKREFVEELGLSEEQMYRAVKAVKKHQSTTLPQTYLHGDAHYNNSYTLADGTVGLYDFQISARGFLTHDITYYIQTSLSVDLRRKHERELLALYRERLCSYGVANPPDIETLWYEYRLSLLYGFYYGWLTAPIENYSWEIMVLGNHRTKASCIDHDVWTLLREIY
jgi:Ecdysteroid kinase-like family